MLALIGFVLMAVLMVVLIKSWVSPPVAFIGLPLIAAVIAGFGAEEIGGFIGSGMKSMLSTAVLFVFSISYFTLMDEIGLFDPVINFLTKKAGKNPMMIVAAIILTTFVAHLDGSGATTFLIVVPAFLPIIKRLGFRKEALLAIICGPYAVMNIVPWGGDRRRGSRCRIRGSYMEILVQSGTDSGHAGLPFPRYSSASLLHFHDRLRDCSRSQLPSD